jgi:putative transcriptional regulator
MPDDPDLPGQRHRRVLPASLRGRLLVANPALSDRNFHRTVVLLIEHNDGGALGVVLNRPTEAPLEGVIAGRPDLEAKAASPGVVFVGGPVEQQAGICLAEVTVPPDGDVFRPLVGPVGTLNLTAPDLVAEGVARLRLFLGYAGWAADQLEGELEAGGWLVAEAFPDDPLTTSPQWLWHGVLKRQKGAVAALAAFPADPRVN